MNKSLTSRIGGAALAAIGGLAAACSSVSVDSVDSKFTEEVRNKYAGGGFLISKKPVALTGLSTGVNTNLGRASVYATDITCHQDQMPHEYDLGTDFSFALDKEGKWSASVGADRYMFPKNHDLGASNEAWASVTRKNLPLVGNFVDSATAKYTNASMGSGEGNIYKISLDKSLEVLGQPFNLTVSGVRNQGYFIGRENNDNFVESVLSTPLYVADDESFRFDLGLKRIDAIGNNHLTDTTAIGITFTLPLFDTAKKKK